jgi:hypothetical protein
MAYAGPCRCVVVVLHVGGSKAFDINRVFKRAPRCDKTWFFVGSILPDEGHVDWLFVSYMRKLALF